MTSPWPVRLLADDLTGALDSAAAFGAGWPVDLDCPGDEDARPAAVSVVATASRDVAPESLPELLAPCVAWLAAAGLAFKKVDSLLRGNTLAEVRWLAAVGKFERVVFAPAFPAQGRFVLGGRLALAAPGRQADDAGLRGDDLRQALQAGPWPVGCDLSLPDVRNDNDLDRVVGTQIGSAHRTLWCGSAGLASAMARKIGPVSGAVAGSPPSVGPVWVVGASHQDVTRRQWERAVGAFPTAAIVRHADDAEFEAVLDRLSVGAPSLALIDLSPLTRLGRGEAVALLDTQASRLATLPRGPARLIVLGGDTARALARATGLERLVSVPAARAGWGAARWRGGRWDGLWMDCRSGAFGNDDDLLAAMGLAGVTRQAAAS